MNIKEYKKNYVPKLLWILKDVQYFQSSYDFVEHPKKQATKHQFSSDPKSAPFQARSQFIKRRMRQIADTGEMFARLYELLNFVFII